MALKVKQLEIETAGAAAQKGVQPDYGIPRSAELKTTLWKRLQNSRGKGADLSLKARKSTEVVHFSILRF
jgi:hypothetical protein